MPAALHLSAIPNAKPVGPSLAQWFTADRLGRQIGTAYQDDVEDLAEKVTLVQHLHPLTNGEGVLLMLGAEKIPPAYG
jgi:hypothetical protein